MKSFLFTLIIILVSVWFYSCNAQPRSNYEIKTDTLPGITKYHFFLEKKNVNPYHLLEDMDYLNPDVTNFRISASSNNYTVINLTNDGSEYTIGLVVEDSKGYYSAMKTEVVNVGSVPNKPATIIFRKIN